MAKNCLGAAHLLFLLGWIVSPSFVQGNIAVIDLESNATRADFADLTAGFGIDFPKAGIEGRIIEANPKNACRPIAAAPMKKDQYDWIVMIARGGKCEFSEKVYYAQVAGFKTALIRNYVDNDSLVKMGSGSKYGSKVVIPSTFVGYTTGMTLVRYFKQHSEYIVRIQEMEHIDYRMYLWPFAIVVGVCFFMILAFLVVKFARDRIRSTVARLSKRHLKKIPIRKYKKGQYYDTCAVCLDEYEDGEKIRILPCDHAYHMKCIDPWLTQNKKTCPICKRRVIPGRDPNSDSDSDDGNGNQERTPLLFGASATPNASHGSINNAALTAPSAARTSGSNGLQDSIDETQGAVGGVGTTMPSGQISGQVQVHIEHEGGGEQREARHSSRKERLEGATSGLVAEQSEQSDRKAERKEKRKKKKEKKRESRKAATTKRQQEEEALLPQVPEGASVFTVEADVERPLDDGAATGVSSLSADEAAAEGYINPSYSDSESMGVVYPGSGSGKKQELNEVV